MKIHGDIIKIICEFMVDTKDQRKDILEWINKDKLEWLLLCQKEEAIHVIEEEYKKNPESDKLCWTNICMNPSAIHLIEKRLDKLTFSEWCYLCENTNSIHILEKNKEQIKWGSFLFRNPKAIHIIKEKISTNPLSIHIMYWNILSENNSKEAVELVLDNIHVIENTDIWSILSRNPSAIPYLYNHKDKIDWYYLSENPLGLPLIEEEVKKNGENPHICWSRLNSNPDAFHLIEKLNPNSPKIFWKHLCSNTNPLAISMIEKNIDKLTENDWYYLSMNPSAIPLIEKHKDKIRWNSLCRNPEAIHLIREELETNGDENIDWYNLSENPSALSIIHEYIDHIETYQVDIWNKLTKNPNIFIVKNSTVKEEVNKLYGYIYN